MDSQGLGIFQGDLIIRTGIIAAINDMRANPWVLDYVFRSLAYDDLTKREYGQKEIDKAKKWFLTTDIPVVNALRVDNIKLPCISISLQDSSEAEKTLGDVNYLPKEGYDLLWPNIAGPFTPTSYDPDTGEVGIPDNIMANAPVTTAMAIVDVNEKSYQILSVDGNIAKILPNQLVSLNNCTLRNIPPAYDVKLESINFNETYVVGCHARGEPYECIYLHSITLFALMRYRQTLFEARGFERSGLSSSDLRTNDAFDAEIVYSRFITLRGVVRQYWPKQLTQRFATSTLNVDVSPSSPFVTVDSDHSAGGGWGWGA